MPFVSVKCPSCGGNIQLDDSRESGFCVYCGAKVMYKEAVQKVEGNVTVEGIAGLEKMLQNAQTFKKIGNFKKASELLTKITQEYPEDWRAWWQLFLDRSHNMDTDFTEKFYKNYIWRLSDTGHIILRKNAFYEELDEVCYFGEAAAKVAEKGKGNELEQQMKKFRERALAQAKIIEESLEIKAKQQKLEAEEKKRQAELKKEEERRQAELKKEEELRKREEATRLWRHQRRMNDIGCFLFFIAAPLLVILVIVKMVMDKSTQGWPLFIIPMLCAIAGIRMMAKGPRP